VDDELARAEELRDKATDARERALTMIDVEMRAILKGIAADYDTMAQTLETIHKSKTALERRRNSR
jgi:hypothetical protein